MGTSRCAGSTGTSSGVRIGRPMFTRARTTWPSRMTGVTSSTPAPVSAVKLPSRSETSPRSTANLAKQRMPLPHISPSEASGLNMRMRRSATSEGSASSRPSEPTPKWRSDTAAASAPQSRSISRASTTTKSLPAPCIFAKSIAVSRCELSGCERCQEGCTQCSVRCCGRQGRGYDAAHSWLQWPARRCRPCDAQGAATRTPRAHGCAGTAGCLSTSTAPRAATRTLLTALSAPTAGRSCVSRNP